MGGPRSGPKSTPKSTKIDPQIDPKIDFLSLSFCKSINLFVVHHHAHRFKAIYSMPFILSVVRRRDHQLESFLLHPVRLSCCPSLRTSQSFGSDFISMHFAQRPLPSQRWKQCSMPCSLLAIVDYIRRAYNGVRRCSRSVLNSNLRVTAAAADLTARSS